MPYVSRAELDIEDHLLVLYLHMGSNNIFKFYFYVFQMKEKSCGLFCKSFVF